MTGACLASTALLAASAVYSRCRALARLRTAAQQTPSHAPRPAWLIAASATRSIAASPWLDRGHQAHASQQHSDRYR
ncbi:hypothetical protein C4K40_0287 [Pseudomonas sp. CMR5c]|nr:hypothetical protein C4K40_0287 [Pseudomonas sp. CMR5c]